MWKFIFSGFLIIVSFTLQAQEVPSLEIVDKPKFYLGYVEVNYNLFRLSQNLLTQQKTAQELQVELGIHKKYTLVATLGYAKTNRGKTYDYANKGAYWRAGIDANISSDTESGNFIGMGLRYARANFEDRISYDQTTFDQKGNPLIQHLAYANPNVTSEWGELVFKMRITIWKQFYAGYTLRYQFLLHLEGADAELKPFDVPGYGKTDQPHSFGFDYYLGWRINFN